MGQEVSEMMKSVAKRVRNLRWIGVAALCLFCAPAPAQQSPLSIFQPTTEDVAPGVDHGNSNDNLPEQFQRQAVFYRSQHPVGTIIIETGERHLYLIESETRALRYGIGVGREGFTWPGLLQISRKSRMAGLASAARDDRAPALSAALHGRRPRQSARRPRHVSRQHRLPHPRHQCAGDHRHAVSSGCFRLVNDDVVDLYDRVPIGTHVIVRQN